MNPANRLSDLERIPEEGLVGYCTRGAARGSYIWFFPMKPAEASRSPRRKAKPFVGPMWDVTVDPGFDQNGHWVDQFLLPANRGGEEDLVEEFGIEFADPGMTKRLLLRIFDVEATSASSSHRQAPAPDIDGSVAEGRGLSAREASSPESATPRTVYGRVRGARSLGALIREIEATEDVSAAARNPDASTLRADFIQRVRSGELADIDGLSLFLEGLGYSLVLAPMRGGVRVDFSQPWAEFGHSE